MANRYIRQGASGANNGTDWTNAWTDRPTTWVRGDTYYFADGSYSAFDFANTALSGTTLITAKKAIAADHGTETGWSSTYGDGQAVVGTCWFGPNTGYILIDGQVGGGPLSWSSGHGFNFTRTGSNQGPSVKCRPGGTISNITIKHAEIVTPFNNKSQDGIYLAGSYFLISDCYLHDMGRCPFLFYTSSHHIVVERCFLDRCGWYKFYTGSLDDHSELFAINANVHDVDIRFNRISGPGPTGTGGVILWNNHYNINIYGNYFYCTEDYANTANNGVIGCQDSDDSGPPYSFDTIRIFQNTFFNMVYTGNTGRRVSAGTVGGVTNSLIRNNLFDTMGNMTQPTLGTRSYNYYRSCGPTNGGQESNGQDGGSSILANPSGQDFSLTVNTDPGLNLGAPYNVDMLGNTRTTWSRGALEFGGAVEEDPTFSVSLLVTADMMAAINVVGTSTIVLGITA